MRISTFAQSSFFIDFYGSNWNNAAHNVYFAKKLLVACYVPDDDFGKAAM